MSKHRFYIDTHGNDDKAYGEALSTACKLSNNDSDIKKVILLTHTLNQTGYFQNTLKPDDLKKLSMGGYKPANCGALFKFESLKTYKDSLDPSEVLIACGLNSKDLSRYDDFYSIKYIIAIPWLQDDLKSWVQTWSVAELRGKQPHTTVLPSPIEIFALNELNNNITGTTNPNDEEVAKKYVRVLNKYTNPDSDIIRAYLVRDLGWEGNDANRIKQWLDTLKSGKSFKGGTGTGLQNYYKKWKEATKGSND